MANKIKDYLNEWQQRDNLLQSFSGGDGRVLQDKFYLRQKLRETDAFIRQQRGKQLTPEERAWLTMLKSGNRHLERQAYPNRIVRYSRRMIQAGGRAVQAIRERLARRREQPDFPVLVNRKPNAAASAVTTKEQQKKQAAKTVQRLQPKNRFAVIEGLNKAKGRTIR